MDGSEQSRSVGSKANKRRLILAVKYAAITLKFSIIFFLLLVFYADSAIRNQTNSLVFSDANDVPVHRVALLLGTAPYQSHGGRNPFFSHRIDAAVALFNAGKVEFILASGDNRHVSYNEPVAMRNELIRRGVPAERIVLDYAGFRTLDSIIRTREVFGQERFVVISQRFHIERALYIAENAGMQAVGFRARDVDGQAMMRVQVREYLARVKALADVHLFRASPRFLGDPIPIE